MIRRKVNRAFVDRFTLAHFAVGLLAGAARLPTWGAVAVAIGWEIVERPLKDAAPKLFPRATQDSFVNSAGDASAMMAGYGSWKLLERKGS